MHTNSTCSLKSDYSQYHKDPIEMINGLSREVKDSMKVFLIPLYLTRRMKRVFGKIYMYLGFHRLGERKGINIERKTIFNELFWD